MGLILILNNNQMKPIEGSLKLSLWWWMNDYDGVDGCSDCV